MTDAVTLSQYTQVLSAGTGALLLVSAAMGLMFLWQRSPEPIRRMGTGFFFGVLGVFLQSLTEWVFRHSPIYYVININLGVLASLYYLKKKAKRMAAEEHQEEPMPETTHEFAPAH